MPSQRSGTFRNVSGPERLGFESSTGDSWGAIRVGGFLSGMIEWS
jgi:hypothetical protein